MTDDLRPAGSVKPPSKLKPIASQNKLPELDNEAFQTPEQVAAHDVDGQPQAVVGVHRHLRNYRQQFKPKFSFSWPPKRQEAMSALAVLFIVGFGVFGFINLHKSKAAPIAKAAAVKAVVPTTVPSTLTGLPVKPSVNKRPVTGVMIENSLDARPQSGLSAAGVVFEAVAEGGVTRFLALYQDQWPSNVGPIRSARPYYIEWDMGFDAPYAHVGGSVDGLSDITKWHVKDLNEFYNGSYYHRISSRAAPHNVYTSLATLNKLEKSKGYTSSKFSGFARKADAPLASPTARGISLYLSGPDYDVHYAYSRNTNSYKRWEGGAAQIDANTKKQLSPKVVIALVVPEHSGALDSSGAYYSDYDVLGSGKAYVFQDGGVTVGSWHKAGKSDQISFTDDNGNPIKLDAGQTWLTAIRDTSELSYHK